MTFCKIGILNLTSEILNGNSSAGGKYFKTLFLLKVLTAIVLLKVFKDSFS